MTDDDVDRCSKCGHTRTDHRGADTMCRWVGGHWHCICKAFTERRAA